MSMAELRAWLVARDKPEEYPMRITRIGMGAVVVGALVASILLVALADDGLGREGGRPAAALDSPTLLFGLKAAGVFVCLMIVLTVLSEAVRRARLPSKLSTTGLEYATSQQASKLEDRVDGGAAEIQRLNGQAAEVLPGLYAVVDGLDRLAGRLPDADGEPVRAAARGLRERLEKGGVGEPLS